MIPLANGMVGNLFAYGVAPRELLTMSYRELTYFRDLAVQLLKAKVG